MSYADGWHWPRILEPFAQVLGPLATTAPILGAIDARLGHYQGEPVWLVWTQHFGEKGQAMMSLASSVGYPLEGHIATDDALRNRAPVTDAEFLHVFQIRVTPVEVAPRALDTAGARACVQRAFRGGGGMRVLLNQGYLWTLAEFRGPPSTAPIRPPSPEEAIALVDDIATLARRFRAAYEECYAEIARSRGESAAQIWQTQARAVGERAQARRRTLRWIQGLVLAGVLGVVVLALACAVTFSLVLSR